MGSCPAAFCSCRIDPDDNARLAASGSAPGNITWRIQGEFRTGSVGTGKASVSLQDAYVRWAKNGIG